MWKRVRAYFQALKFILLIDKCNEEIQALEELSPIAKREYISI